MTGHRAKIFAGIGIVLAVIAIWILFDSPVPAVEETARQPDPMVQEKEPETQGEITGEEAVKIARQALRGKLEIPSEVVPASDFRENEMHWIVTFPFTAPHIAPNELWLGPDYYAQVTIDARTGDVIQVLAGS